MNKQFITDFILNKNTEEEIRTKEIEKMINLFPYCETIRKIDLLIKGKNHDVTFEETLPKVAIYSSNRKNLFLLLLKGKSPLVFNEIFLPKKNTPQTKKQSFHEWLQNTSINFNVTKTESVRLTPKSKSTELIIKNNQTPTDDLMTETLAKLYLEQKHFNQAIRAYNILRLKYPKKSSLFASEIKKITKLKSKNEL